MHQHVGPSRPGIEHLAISASCTGARRCCTSCSGAPSLPVRVPTSESPPRRSGRRRASAPAVERGEEALRRGNVEAARLGCRARQDPELAVRPALSLVTSMVRVGGPSEYSPSRQSEYSPSLLSGVRLQHAEGRPATKSVAHRSATGHKVSAPLVPLPTAPGLIRGMRASTTAAPGRDSCRGNLSR